MKQSVSNYDFLSFIILLKFMQINVPLSMIVLENMHVYIL